MEKLPTAGISKILDPEHILGPDGPIAEKFDNYEPRQPQIQMASAVRETLKTQEHFFCEAGTGTGKSYAFLIPAIEAALRTGEGPVVVSTNTISLQEQIFRKDIPDLKKYLGLPNLRVVLRKGRGNYLSRRRLQNAHNYEWDVDQIPEIESIEDWADKTLVGSKQDLDFIPSGEVWDQVRSDQYDCLGQKCPKHKQCFYFNSKEEAAKAHLIICNHSLLALDLGIKMRTDNNTGILPTFKHLIVDEAHALEEAIRRAETFEWKQGSAAAFAKRATNKKDKGFLDLLIKNGEVPGNILRNASEAKQKFKQLVEVNALFFKEDVEPFVRQGIRGRQKPPAAKRIRPGNLRSPRSESMINLVTQISKHLGFVASELGRISSDEEASSSVKQLALLLKNFHSRVVEVKSELGRAVFADKDQDQPFPTHVSSVETEEYKGNHYYSIVSTPIFVRNISQKMLFSKIPSITLCSATLTTNSSFNGIIRNLGAFPNTTRTLKLPHVFDYKNKVEIFLTPNAPLDPWNKPDERKRYFENIANAVKKYVHKTKGNALILCTSNLQMKALYDNCVEDLTARGMYVLRQGGGMTREQLVEEIKQVPNTVLFGVDSFWTGVDIPGPHLQNVIIPKIPFPPPTPLSEAQQEIYDVWNRGKPRNRQRNYFADRTIPEVAIKLQQGFGRLIRHRDDSGIVVLMDPRLSTKRYGQTLLGSLPDCKITED